MTGKSNPNQFRLEKASIIGQPDRIPLAKLTPPNLPLLVERTHLFERFDRIFQQGAKVLWIQGPPGVGKTTLAASYLRARKLPALWYQLDTNDADAATWFHYLKLAIQKAVPHFYKPMLVFDAAYLTDLRGFTRLFFEHLYERLNAPAALVFDNYHDLPDEGSHHELMVEAFGKIPQGWSCIVTSRRAPPKDFARLIADQMLIEFPADQLFLNVQEIQELLQLHYLDQTDKLSEEWTQHLYNVTKGWVAGIILLGTKQQPNLSGLSAPTTPLIRTDVSADDPILLDYFAQEGLARLPENVRALLLKTSIFPAFTATMAKRFTGMVQAGYELRKLMRASYFVENRGGDHTVFQYHPLFKQFLSQQGEVEFGADAWFDLQENAGKLLVQEGWTEEAIQLFFDAGLSRQASTLLLQQAPILLEQGRFQALGQSLAQLDKETFENQPYLYYWLGMSRLFENPTQSLPIFESVFAIFKDQENVEGMLLAASGAIYSIDFSWSAFNRIDPWLLIINDLWEKLASELSPEIQSSTIIAMMRGLFWRQSHRTIVQTWIERALVLIQYYDRLSELTILIHHIYCLARCFGDVQENVQATIQVIKRIEDQVFSPPNQLSWAISQTGIAWVTGAFKGAHNHYQRGLDLLIGHEVPVFRGPLMFNGLYAALHDQDLALAETIISKGDQYGQQMGPVFYAIGIFQRGWYYALKGDMDKALDFARQSVLLTKQCQGLHVEATANLGLALILTVVGRFEEGEKIISPVELTAHEIQHVTLLYTCHLLRAFISLETQDHMQTRQILSDGMVLGKQYEIFFTYESWLPQVLAPLCAFALEEAIEPDYVRDLIRVKRLTLDSQSAKTTEWPWPIRIITLGQFVISKEDEKITFGRKPPVMPLRLLKLIICLGGQNISMTRLSDLLWPDAEGDAAYRSLLTNLARVRKILDLEDVLIVQGGELSLNFKLCWVDSLAYVYLARTGLAAHKNGRIDKAGLLIGRAKRLYNGAFLGSNDELIEYVNHRDKLARFDQELNKIVSGYYQDPCP